jgi:hypothetical protein
MWPAWCVTWTMWSGAHKSPHLSYTPFQLNQEIDIRDVNVLALDVAKTSHERS